MKKIMKERFMFVGTLEEAEFNRVVSVAGVHGGHHLQWQFAGRNWNHGQSIELVLRNARGQFLPWVELGEHFSRLTGKAVVHHFRHVS